MSKACHNIVLASRGKEKPMSDDEEEEGEVDESSGQEVSNSEGDNSEEEESESGEDGDASDVTEPDPFIDDKARYVVCGVAWV